MPSNRDAPGQGKARAARRPRSPARSKPRERDALETALASFAHEIRTPLNGILALAELLSASDLPERERGWAAALKTAAEHLAGLTSVIVDGARAKARGLTVQRQAFDVPALARALAQSLAARAAVKGLSARETISAELPAQAVGDPVRLRAAVENLIDNAVKFTDTGCVSFAVTGEPTENGRLRLAFVVSDEGAGLSQAELRRLFRPFGQANRRVGLRFGGAGLGLVFARNVARAMDGDITVESAPGQGSTFRLTAVVDVAAATGLPLGAGGADSRRRTPANGRALRLLCAEDNPFGRVVLNTIASALGHQIDFVQAGDAVVEAVRTGTYDAVLMDIMMPGTDGIGATRRIRALAGPAGAIPVIGISGAGAADEAAARAAGMNAYLVKPIGPRALARALAAVTAAGDTRRFNP
ncbi:MAG: response regulator [Variibacter sp.]|nr:response regulator [Variibacter sp.]